MRNQLYQVVESINNGVHINIEKYNQLGLLHYAVCDGNIMRVESLLSEGLDINTKDSIGLTPLYKAITMRENNIAIIELLLKHGADCNIRSNIGFTPLYALLSRRLNEDYDPDFDGFEEDELEREIEDRKYKNRVVFNLLIKYGADVNIQGEEGHTPLMQVSFIGDVERAKMLLENGADIGIKSNSGKNALFFAKEYGGLEMLDFLLTYQAKSLI